MRRAPIVHDGNPVVVAAAVAGSRPVPQMMSALAAATASPPAMPHC